MKEFTTKYPVENRGYSEDRESAAFTAFESEKFEIYNFLISSGYSLGQHETIYATSHFKEAIESLHGSIREGYSDECESFLSKYPFENFAFNISKNTGNPIDHAAEIGFKLGDVVVVTMVAHVIANIVFAHPFKGAF